MPKWTITYHTITQESAEAGDYADSGYIMPGGMQVDVETDEDREAVQFDSLKQALSHITPQENSGRWFSTVDPDIDYRTGEDEYRQLHPPSNITKSSYNRVKRVLRVR